VTKALRNRRKTLIDIGTAYRYRLAADTTLSGLADSCVGGKLGTALASFMRGRTEGARQVMMKEVGILERR
jgi:hypothetical protein